MGPSERELFWCGVGGAIVFVVVWLGIWLSYGVLGALFGWIPAAIIGGISWLALAFFWRVVLAIAVLLGVGIWLLVQCGSH